LSTRYCYGVPNGCNCLNNSAAALDLLIVGPREERAGSRPRTKHLGNRRSPTTASQRDAIHVHAVPFSDIRLTPPARSAVGAGRIQCQGGANERLQCLFINLVALMEIDGAPGVAIEAGVEEA
jgi:hypothetical protein